MELRPAFDALLAIDDAMAEIVATATQPALAAIKLAWWREALEKLDHAPTVSRTAPERTLTPTARHQDCAVCSSQRARCAAPIECRAR